MLNVINPYTFDSAILPYRVDVMAWSSADAVSGMTYLRNANNTTLGGGSAFQQNAADADSGDYMEWNVLTAAGTWRIDLFYVQGADKAVLDVLIDGTSIGTADAYAAGTSRNVVASFTGVALAAGNHVLRVAANGKNAASSDYIIQPQTLALTRTGA